jgi:hypothetical protein
LLEGFGILSEDLKYLGVVLIGEIKRCVRVVVACILVLKKETKLVAKKINRDFKTKIK